MRGCQYGNHCCVLAVTLHGNCGDMMSQPHFHILPGVKLGLSPDLAGRDQKEQ